MKKCFSHRAQLGKTFTLFISTLHMQTKGDKQKQKKSRSKLIRGQKRKIEFRKFSLSEIPNTFRNIKFWLTIGISHMVLDLTRRAVFLSQGVPVQNRTTNRRYLSQKWVILWTYLLGILGWLQSNLPLIDKTNLILLNFVSNDFPSQIDDRISGFPIWFWTWSQKNDWAECHKSGLNRINRRSLLCIQSLVQSMARASNFDDDDFSTADLFSTANFKFYCQFYRRFSVAVEVAVDM